MRPVHAIIVAMLACAVMVLAHSPASWMFTALSAGCACHAFLDWRQGRRQQAPRMREASPQQRDHAHAIFSDLARKLQQQPAVSAATTEREANGKE